MQKELSNPSFCFLRRDDPYRPYYENKITEFARGLVGKKLISYNILQHLFKKKKI